MLETIERDRLLEHINELGGYFHARLRALQAKHALIAEVRGAGFMAGVELSDAEAAKYVAREALARGVIVNRTHEVVIRMLPPFIVQKQHVDTVVRLLDQLLGEYAAQAQPRATLARRKA